MEDKYKSPTEDMDNLKKAVAELVYKQKDLERTVAGLCRYLGVTARKVPEHVQIVKPQQVEGSNEKQA